ncbi:hypothetical protein ASPWEDRAFT_32211 [Aspergillus wentii DTO 134E9]|uniref:Cystathionine gamma-synthase n=1 Tax=Aspergillus wentii DTO 134E9 TaxID=1073089 RepID=A0A1L9R9I5_ASPWE|nr:uncharacterized protein ASPWEDRAFT_32211 [Aspergillus wentii DTO 134E9]KAI9926379.1 hypothetical protein MW887_004143 [Aspergillus wentii]OJJ31586.1 hypothetical protein ASPWEDRAFT_32211 [Aspergillus wentii DTO 134E9]
MMPTTHPPSPHALPLGEAQPPNQVHSVSVSMPKWDTVVAWGNREDWVVNSMQTVYPRFFIHHVLRSLTTIIKRRLEVAADLDCMLFPSDTTAGRFYSGLKTKDAEKVVGSVRFFLTGEVEREETLWGKFHAVFYHKDLDSEARRLWMIFGDGLSTRQAEFCLERVDFMLSESAIASFQTAAPCPDLSRLPRPVPWTDSAISAKEQMKNLIARLATSESPGSRPVSKDDVFLYSKGMCAIGAVARSLLATIPDKAYSGSVVYGWPYAETPKLVELVGYHRFTLYGRGTEAELDDLEASLKSGQRIRALFCELPCNPLLESPNLERIRALADEYDFVVACDETLGTFVNVDLFPYVDVIMTSLTKIFSGASNVMGGSVVVNPDSRHHDAIHAGLVADYEDAVFPLDAITLAHNSADFEERTQRCNHSALAIATMLSSHPSIQHVNYPTMVSSAPLYELYRRRDGGYGFLLSMVFRQPESAICFYDALDVCKGPSIGTNFTLAIPYSQLAHFRELDWAESYGVLKHIVRISVGMEEQKEVLDRISQALVEVERFEKTCLLPTAKEQGSTVLSSTQTATMVS